MDLVGSSGGNGLIHRPRDHGCRGPIHDYSDGPDGLELCAALGDHGLDVIRRRVRVDLERQHAPRVVSRQPSFSGLIGGTHAATVTFWAEGSLASDGIKNMAELGKKTPLDSEVEAAIQAGIADGLLWGGGISPSPGSVELTFDVNVDFPLVTLVSMIAPSPDWFVGVSSLSLLEEGSWVNSVVIELFAYDAGTDSGVMYTSPNEATDPRANASRIIVSPFDVASPLGTFTFTRSTGG